MKKIFQKLWKKNQIMITALVCMIALAGYLNFTGRNVEDEALYTNSASFEEGESAMNSEEEVSTIYDISDEDIEQTASVESVEDAQDMYSDIESLDEDFESVSQTQLETAQGAKEGEIPGETVFTSSGNVVNLQEANMMREQVRAQNKETLLDIINNSELSEEAKTDAIASMVKLTENAAKECDAQMLLEAKGFENAVVSIGETGVDVMIGMEELNEAQRAQIEDIVKRKTNVSAENIIISPVGK